MVALAVSGAAFLLWGLGSAGYILDLVAAYCA